MTEPILIGATPLGVPVTVPLDAVVEKLAWMGRTGSGKTYAAKGYVEALLLARAQVLVLDPVGVWYGLRVPGAGAGFAVPVFGGLHGDLPLGDKAGKQFAELVFERRISAVFDLSQMLDAEQHRFVADFTERLFELHRGAPRAVHVVMEECQHFIPQEKTDVPSRLVNRVARLCMVGRNFGIGVSMISQAPQSVHKRCLNQAGYLFAFQTKGAHERKAIEGWFSDKGIDFDIGAELPQLRNHEGLMFSDASDEPVRYRSRQLQTRDTSSTPKVGQVSQALTLTPMDIDALREQMAEVVQQCEADDPVLLRRRITELELKLSRQQGPQLPTGWKDVLKDGLVTSVERALDLFVVAAGLEKPKPDLRAVVAIADQAGIGLDDSRALAVTREGKRRHEEMLAKDRKAATPRNTRMPIMVELPIESLKKNEVQLLIKWAVYGRRSLAAICIVAHYSRASSGPGKAATRLRELGLIDGDNADAGITERGRAWLDARGGFEPLPESGAELVEAWMRGGALSSVEGVMLERIVAAYPGSLNLAQAGQGYSLTSSGPGKAATKLRLLGLVHGDNSAMRADPLLAGETTKRKAR